MENTKLLQKKWLQILLFILLALFSRFLFLYSKSVFDDEFMILGTIVQPVKDICAYCFSDVHPPLFRLLLHLFTCSKDIWNERTVFLIRLISALSGSLLVIPVFLFADRYMNRKTAILASFGIILSTVLLEVSQEGRVYALSCLVFMLSYYLALSYEKNPSLFKRFGYCIVTLAGLYLNYWMVFVLFAQWVLIGKWMLEKNGNRKYVLDTLLIISGYSPWFAAWFLNRLKEPVFQDKITTLIPLNIYLPKMLYLDRELLTGYETLFFHNRFFLFFIIATLAGWGAYALWKKDKALTLSLLSIAVIPQLMGFIDGFVLYSKYLSFTLPAIIILAAYGLAQWKPKPALFIITVILALQLPLLVNYYSSGVNPYVKQDFRGLAAYLKTNLQPADEVVSYGNHWIPNFYMDYPMNHIHYQTPESGFPGEVMISNINTPQHNRVWLTFLTFQEKDIDQYLLPYVKRDIISRQEYGQGIKMILLGKLHEK